MSLDVADREWFTSQVLGLLPHLLGTARRLTGNSADAEDLVAEAVARAWINRGALQRRDHFRGWTFRILTNLFLEGRRAQMAHPIESSLDEVSEDFSLFERVHQPFLLWWGDPEREFLDRLFREELERAVDALPDCYRVVVTLADIQDLGYKEIADLLRVPIGTVRSRLARGRSLLQKALWEHAVDAGLGRTPSGTRTNLP
jgi:RNA polymerase sigma-70 factor (ECF subfamily)